MTLGLLLWFAISPFCVRRVRARIANEKLNGMVASGTCLRPWITDGDIIGWDELRKPQDGDLVATRTRVQLRAGLAGTRAREIAIHGAKQLRVDRCGRRWLACADGSYDLDDPEAGHELVGVVTHVGRRPWRKAPAMCEVDFPIRPVS